MCSNHHNKQAAHVNNDDSSHFNDQENAAIDKKYELDTEHTEEENEDEEEDLYVGDIKDKLSSIQIPSKPADLQSNASQNSPYNSYFSNRTYIEEQLKKLTQNTFSNLRPEHFKQVNYQLLEKLSENFASSGTFTPDRIQTDLQNLFGKLQACTKLREKYMQSSLQRIEDNPANQDDWEIYPPPPPSHWSPKDGNAIDFDFNHHEIPGPIDQTFEMNEAGVYQVLQNDGSKTPVFPNKVPTLKQYFMDLDSILQIISDGPVKSFAYRRLRYLESKFQLYSLLNEYQELAQSKSVPHRDFYNVRKVDTHIHHSACMNQKHLLRFIKSKLKKFPDDVVIYRDDKHLTLAQVFESLNLTTYDLSIDTLDMHAHKDSFHRFDKFNLKYNPVGESRLREIFLKTDNFIKGRYLAELTREVISDLEASKYQMAEYRISIYGRSLDEWDKLADWVIDNSLVFHNVRWLIQVPRLYSIYQQTKSVGSFADVIHNIFQPLFEVTQNPQSHPKLHVFLQRVIGFDSVDDESRAERRIHKKYPYPKNWTMLLNPPYGYYLYYMFANMAMLNHWRRVRNFNTFVLRPHSGEAGDPEHLAAAFLTSQGISHGILLRKVPALQYLYYLNQIPIAMSPLSNNALFLKYERNPFYHYFERGLNISISTDDPLQFHFTKEPLIEEYSVAAQIWKLSPTDMCEIARNSVLQSGFELQIKKKWLGDNCLLSGVNGNDMQKTNLPDIRINFRHETLLEEVNMIKHFTNSQILEELTLPQSEVSTTEPIITRADLPAKGKMVCVEVDEDDDIEV